MFKLILTVVATAALSAQAVNPSGSGKDERTAECYAEYMYACVENIDGRTDFVEVPEFYTHAVYDCIDEAFKHVASNGCNWGRE